MLTDLAYRASWWMMQCILWVGWVCLAASMWRASSEAAPFFCPIIAGAPSVVPQTRREESREHCSTHWSTFGHTSITNVRPPSIKLNTCCSASIPEWKQWFAVFQFLYLISDRRNLHHDSRHWPHNFAHETGFFGWGFAGRIAMLLPSRVAGRTLGLRGPDLARGPEVAHRWCMVSTLIVYNVFCFVFGTSKHFLIPLTQWSRKCLSESGVDSLRTSCDLRLFLGLCSIFLDTQDPTEKFTHPRQWPQADCYAHAASENVNRQDGQRSWAGARQVCTTDGEHLLRGTPYWIHFYLYWSSPCTGPAVILVI